MSLVKIGEYLYLNPEKIESVEIFDVEAGKDPSGREAEVTLDSGKVIDLDGPLTEALVRVLARPAPPSFPSPQKHSAPSEERLLSREQKLKNRIDGMR